MALRRSRKDRDDDVTDADLVVDDDQTEAEDDAPAGPTGPGVRSLLVPMVVIALVGVLTVSSLVSVFKAFRPHNLPIAIAADASSVAFFKKQLGGGKDPAFHVQGVPSGQTPASLIKSRKVYGVLVLGQKAWQLQYAGANGSVVNAQLQASFQPADPKVAYRTIDLVPSAPGDRSGWSVFFLVLGIVLASFAFGVLLGFRADKLPPRTVRLGLLSFSLLTAVVSTLVVRFVFNALAGNLLIPCLLQTLLAFSVTGLTVVAVRFGRMYGAAIAAALFIAAGTALSGALLPPPYLVPGLQHWVNVLPSGLAAQSTTAAAYFGGATFGVGLYGLVGWTILTLVLLSLLDRRHQPEPAAEADTDA